jgi:hypothetical protein
MTAVRAQLATFLSEPLVAVIATRRRDDTIAMTPVWFEYRDQRFWLNSYEAAAWPKRVQRQGGLVLLVIDPADTLRTAQFDCELEAVQRDGARRHIDALSERYLGHSYRGPHQERLILTLAPTRIRTSLS